MTFLQFAKQAKAIFAKVKWSQEQLVNGMLIEYDGDEIDKSSVIYQVSPDGYKSPLPDGQYKTKDGVLFELTDGKVSSVEDNSNTAPGNDQPVKQAQSADDKPKGKYGDVEYADEKDKKYPIDTEEHIRAAWNYINKSNTGYDPEELKKVKDKIISAWKDKIDPKGPPSAQSQSKPMSLPIKKPAAKAPAKVEPVAPVKADEVEDMTTEDPDNDGDDDASDDATSFQEILEQALAPITAALQQILSACGSTTEMAKKTETELSKVKETVTKLAEEPAPEKKETKEIKNPFAKPQIEPSETRTYQIMKAIAKK